MPRYWFNVRDGDQLLLDDDEGSELANFDAARIDAMEAARQILSEAASRGTAASLRLQIEVVDDAGDTILIIPVGHATGTDSQQ